MSKMYIMNDHDLSEVVHGKVWSLINETGSWVGTADQVEPLLCAIADPESQDPISIYETDPEMASACNEETREFYLFGLAFDDQWCRDDVYVIMVHENGRAWVRGY